jgi:hypothetical protein
LLLFEIIYQEKIKITLDFVLDKANLNKFKVKHFGKIGKILNEHSGDEHSSREQGGQGEQGR